MDQRTSLKSSILKNVFFLMIFLMLAEKTMCIDNDKLPTNERFAPTISNCPSNITVTISSGCSAIINWTEPTASDPDGILSFTSDYSSGDSFGVGRTTVTYIAVNNNNDQSTCSFTVNVKLSTSYALSGCPSDIAIDVNTSCNRAVSWVAPTVPCGVILASTHAPGDEFPIGDTPVTYFSSKDGDIYASCTFMVTVNDNIAPQFSNLPNNMTVAANANCEAVVDWTVPTVTDNCTSGIIPISIPAPGSTFSLGTTTVSYTAEDEAGNMISYDFDVTVTDQTAPDFDNLPGDRVVIADAISCEATVTWPTVTATDNCDTSVDVVRVTTGDTFPLGTTSVFYTATDDAGNVNASSFDITVIDETPPVLTNCPNTVTVSANNNCDAIATWSSPTFVDSCDPTLSITQSHNSGDVFPIGTTTVNISATDDAGNETTCSFDVIVEDNTPPVFSNCPSDITVVAGEECNAIANWNPPTVSDNCTSGITPSSNLNSGDIFTLGTTEVVYTATDNAGNQVTCTFNVIVVDQTPPTFTNLPEDRVVAASNANCEATVTWPAVNAADNCDSSVDVVRDIAGSTFPLGTTTIVYTATDDAGNQTTGSFNITVVDETAPVLSNCPGNVTVSANDNCSAIATWSLPTFEDSCDPALSITQSHNSGDVFPIGTTTVTITATDAAGNVATCSFDVVVEDNTPPAFINCPTDITVATGEECNTIAEWTPPTVTDSCTSGITPSANFNPGDVFALGATAVTYTATDDSGNQITCTFNVIVVDQTAPAFSDCPADIEIAAGSSCDASVTWAPPTATDNCDGNVTISSSHNSGDRFEIGTTSVTYTATDDGGNTSQCTFNVTVVDRTGPEIVNCPSDLEITTADCEVAVSWDEPAAIDNCSSATVSANFSPGDSFPLGTTAVFYNFIDNDGNESQCTFNVIVLNPDALELVGCPEDITVETDDSGTAAVSWPEPSAISSCSEVSASQSHFPGDTFEEGTTEVSYEFVDAFETAVTCTFNVTVKIRDIVFDIPQLLTPNNDGNNDTWILEGIENFPDNEVVIIDRWGGELFKKSGYDNERIVWDGTNKNGKIVPTGTYFYYITVQTNSESQKKQGFIEVLR